MVLDEDSGLEVIAAKLCERYSRVLERALAHMSRDFMESSVAVGSCREGGAVGWDVVAGWRRSEGVSMNSPS